MRHVFRGIVLVAVFGTLGWSPAAEAAARNPGWYVAGGPSLVFQEFDVLKDVGAPVEVDDSNLGASLRLGRAVSRHVATEVALQYVPRFDFAVGRVAGDIGGFALTGNVKGYLGDGRVRPYGSLGLGFVFLDPNSNATFNNSAWEGVASLGVGLEFETSENWDVFVDLGYYLPFSSLSDFDFLPLTAGVKYRF